MIFSLFTLIFLPYPIYGQFYCADQIQRCGLAAEDAERQINLLKSDAFKSCVRRPACHDERRIFDSCFRHSLRAVRSPFTANEEIGDSFSDASERFRSAIDQCFMNSPLVPRRTEFGPTLIDEDAVYARAIYNGELGDRMWGLPETISTRPGLDSLGVCRVRDYAMRVFGGGISRTMYTADPKINNLTSACLLDESELICYRQYLEQSGQYNQLIFSRDYTIRACLQNVRIQSPCRNNDHSRVRACVCGAREEFDRLMQNSILDCVRRNSPRSILGAFRGNLDDSYMPSRSSYHNPSLSVNMNILPASSSSSFSSRYTSPGELINGRCMCSCNSITSPFNRYSNSVSGMGSDSILGTSGSFSSHGSYSNPTYGFGAPLGSAMESLRNGNEYFFGSNKFQPNSPRLMQPSEAMRNIVWGSGGYRQKDEKEAQEDEKKSNETMKSP